MVHQILTPPPVIRAQDALPHLLEAALAGARAILATPPSPPQAKSDGSPVTQADLNADAAIAKVLKTRLAHIPIVSEESCTHLTDFDPQKPFILVDPLDGTRDYVAGTGEYVVCIALVIARKPAAGVIVAPTIRRAWTAAGDAHDLQLTPHMEVKGGSKRVIRIEGMETSPVLLRSRSHGCQLADRLQSWRPDIRRDMLGSALKFGRIASGEGTLYPRDAGSAEWDTAAGECILAAAGGVTLDPSGHPIVYGKVEEGFRNPSFIASTNAELVRDAYAYCRAC